MKTLLTAILSVLLFPFSTPQPANAPIPVCHGNVVAIEVADLVAQAADPAFQALHHEPLAFHYVSQAGETVRFSTPDGKSANGFLLKAARKSDKWLLVYQEWWGLNDHIKQQAERFYNDLNDVNVLAVDMYDGKVATKREEAAQLVQSVSPARLQSILKGAIAYAGPQARIASVGWCFGGAMSLQSALLAGKQATGCVIYYGRPEQDVARLKTLETDVLGIFGSQDKGIPPATVAKFEENMREAGETVEIRMYDADHAFANPSNPKFDKEAAADAYARTLAYLKARLNT